MLSRLVSERGAPRYLRSGNGPEFVSKALLGWIVDEGIESALIDPGKPWQNGTNESFNGKFRDECLMPHGMDNLRLTCFSMRWNSPPSIIPGATELARMLYRPSSRALNHIKKTMEVAINGASPFLRVDI